MGDAPGEPSVLVVEDERDLRDTLHEILEDEGYAVASAADGKQAIDRIQASARPPALIVLDLMMPVMDGWQFLAWLKNQPPELASTPVLIMSAIGAERLQAAATAFGGGVTSLDKPIDLDTFLASVARLKRGSAEQGA